MQKLFSHRLIVNDPTRLLVLNAFPNPLHELGVGHDLQSLLDPRVILIGQEHGHGMSAAGDDDPVEGRVGLAGQLAERLLRLGHIQESLSHRLHLLNRRWLSDHDYSQKGGGGVNGRQRGRVSAASPRNTETRAGGSAPCTPGKG